MLDKAIRIAAKAHEGQTDRLGNHIYFTLYGSCLCEGMKLKEFVQCYMMLLRIQILLLNI